MAYDLEGTSSYFTGPAAAVNLNTGTFAGWFKPDFDPSTTTGYAFFDVLTCRYALVTTAANTIQWYCDGRLRTVTTTGKWVAGQWIHVAAVYDKTANSPTMYINGVDAAGSLSGTWGANIVGTLRVGSKYDASAKFDGSVGPFATWSRVLSLAEIQGLASGKPPEQFPSGLLAYWKLNGSLKRTVGTADLTAVGSPVKAPDPFIIGAGASQVQPSGGKGYDFNGSSQRATAASTVVNQDEFSVSAWMRPGFTPASTTARQLHDSQTCQYTSYKATTTNLWGLYADGRTATFPVTGLWVAGDWVHVVSNYKKTGDVLELFINGVPLTPTKSGVWGTNVLGATFYLGSSPAPGNYFLGAISNTATFNRILTQAEVTQLATGAKASTISSLSSAILAQWDMEDDLTADVGAVNLTGVSSPVLGRYPSWKPQIREGFEGTGYEIAYPAAWTVTGTPTADSYVDPDSPVPGNPSFAGAQCLKVAHKATENLVYISRNINGGLGANPTMFSCYMYWPALPTAEALRVLALGTAALSSVIVRIETTGVVTVQYHIAAGWQDVTIAAPGASKWHRLDIEYSATLGVQAIRWNGVVVQTGSVIWDRGTPAQVLIGPSQGTVAQVGTAYISSVEFRTDRTPTLLDDPTKVVFREGFEF